MKQKAFRRTLSEILVMSVVIIGMMSGEVYAETPAEDAHTDTAVVQLESTEPNTPPAASGTETTTPPAASGTEPTTPPAASGTETTTPPAASGTETTTPPAASGTESTTPPAGETGDVQEPLLTGWNTGDDGVTRCYDSAGNPVQGWYDICLLYTSGSRKGLTCRKKF